MKQIYCKVCFTILVVMFTYTFFEMDSNYKELLQVNETLLDQLEKEKQANVKSQKTLREEYETLKEDYYNSLKEIERLNKVIEMYENSNIIPEYEYTKSEVLMLAKCVQAEAGEKNYKSQKMITKVILNRLESGEFPNTLQEVVYQKRNNIPQFSVAYNGALENQDVSYGTFANVYSVLLFDYNMPSNILYFYAESVEENWVNKLRVYDIVQGTVFAYK